VNGATVLSGVLYEPFGPPKQWTWGNATVTTRSYDTDGKVTQIVSAGTHNYSYDNAFRITGIADNANSALSWTYGYDLMDRLNSATKTGTTIGYTFDANGNRLSQTGTSASTYTVSPTSNRVSSISGALPRTYGYNAAGNTTSYSTNTLAYNNRGRLKSLTKSGTTTSYVYDPMGQLIQKTGAIFFYDEAGHALGQYTGSGTFSNETVWMGDIPVATLRPKTGGGVDVYYIHTDHLNTPRKITQPSDNKVRWRWDSDPFGTTLPNENPEAVGTFGLSLRFPGQIYFSEAGLHYNYFRDYDPSVGRYAQSDPIGLNGGLSTYVYVGGSPSSFADPLGLYIPKDTANCKVMLYPAFDRRYGQRLEWLDKHQFNLMVPIVFWYHRDIEVVGYVQKTYRWQDYNQFGLWEHNQNYIYVCTDVSKCGKSSTTTMAGNDHDEWERYEGTGTRRWSDPWDYIAPFNHPPTKLPPPFPE